MLSLAQDDGRRIWVILDELPTLHQVPSLQPGLAESRQFGGCFVLGVQVASALRDLYGRNGAETISGLCGTRVVLAAPDRDTAQWSADSLGRSEVEEVAENVSYGANTIRDGVSLTPRRELRALALPADIMRLPNLHGYLKFPGPYPVASIKLKPVGRPVRAPRFVPREDREPPAQGGEHPIPAPPAGTAGSSDQVLSPEIAEEPFWQGELDLGWREPSPEEPLSTVPAMRPGMGNSADQVFTRPTADAKAPSDVTLPPEAPETSRKAAAPPAETAPLPVTDEWA